MGFVTQGGVGLAREAGAVQRCGQGVKWRAAEGRRRRVALRADGGVADGDEKDVDDEVSDVDAAIEADPEAAAGAPEDASDDADNTETTENDQTEEEEEEIDPMANLDPAMQSLAGQTNLIYESLDVRMDGRNEGEHTVEYLERILRSRKREKEGDPVRWAITGVNDERRVWKVDAVWTSRPRRRARQKGPNPQGTEQQQQDPPPSKGAAPSDQ